MRRILLLLVCACIPLSARALEYRNLSLLYTDAPFLPAESAGISLLTSLGAVEGNPDGTFRAGSRINRAEFLKIALASHPRIRVSSSDAERCFPDVKREDWFSKYVCLAKKRDIVGGYPDGEFKGWRSVNYAEALKILSELYDYIGVAGEDEAWFMPYVRASQFHKTALPVALPYDRALTRGQMARLAAAYRAHYEGELERYRLSERDLDLVLKDGKDGKDEEDGKEEENENEAEDDNEGVQDFQSPSFQDPKIPLFPLPAFPTTSHQILLGETETIADGYFEPRNEEVFFNSVTVKLRKESRTIAEMYLVDEEGVVIATLKKDLYDDEERTWKGVSESDTPYFMGPAGSQLALRVRIKARDSEGFPNELMQVKWMSAVVTSKVRPSDSYQLVAAQPHYPPHITVQARITAVANTHVLTGSLVTQGGQLLARFAITGEILTGTRLQIDDLQFSLQSTPAVVVRNVVLNREHECTVGSHTVNCTGLPLEMGLIAEGDASEATKEFEVYGDVTFDAEEEEKFFGFDLSAAGTMSTTLLPGEDGSIHWSDGSGHYFWVDLPEPLGVGTRWR